MTAILDNAILLSTYPKILVLAFLLTLPLVNPWVRGDGVGYYAYVHALLIHHDLNFETEWRSGNSSFTSGRLDANGKVVALQYTRTGHIANHWSIGPSMLWAPFLLPVHLVMLAMQRLGLHVNADGFSKPYTLTMALATAFYGFIGLLLSYKLARNYTEERWAFLATLGIWFASSLPVYMYFNPSWSHAHSVFIVALFLWYWHRTRQDRTLGQWLILGLLTGLMLDVYYPNVVFILVPLLQSLQRYWRSWCLPARKWAAVGRLFFANVVYSLAVVTAFTPTLMAHHVIYGHALSFGAYETVWRWKSPMLVAVLFSSDHGLLTWTPILIPALLGLFLFWKYDPEFSAYLIVAFLAFYYLISADSTWDGIGSFGNRYFISLTPVFVLAFSVVLNEMAKRLKSNRAAIRVAVPVIGSFVLWNWAFIFQWGMHLVPVRGPISWKQMVTNQVSIVPQQLFGQMKCYFGNRSALMRHIEVEDRRQLERQVHKSH